MLESQYMVLLVDRNRNLLEHLITWASNENNAKSTARSLISQRDFGNRKLIAYRIKD